MIPKIEVSSNILSSIRNYVFDDTKDIFFGKFSKNFENQFLFDSIDCNSNEKNVLLNTKLISSKEERKDKILFLIEKAYDHLKKTNNNYELSSFYHMYYIFNREENLNCNSSSKKLNCKVYNIFPNVNFEIKQIKNLSFSNTQLNKYLVSRSTELEENTQSGFFTMSQNHRLIALKDDTSDNGNIKNSQSLKQIIFGIWINLKHEKPSPKAKDFDNLFEKYKMLIYKKCFDYVQITNKIDTVYSPSPDQGTFILVLFYNGIQCHYEVKMLPNEEDKVYPHPDIKELSSFGCNWILSKTKFSFENNQSLEYSLLNNLNKTSFMTMSDYLSKKTGVNQQSFLTKSTTTKLASSKISNVNFQDNIPELFDNTNLEIDDMEDEIYNYPLIMPQNFYKKSDTKKVNDSRTSNNSNKVSISDKGNSQMNTNNNSNTTANTNNRDSVIAVQNATEIVLEHNRTIQQLNNKISVLEMNIKNVLETLMRNPPHQVKEEPVNNLPDVKSLNDNETSKIINQSLKVPKIYEPEFLDEDDI